MNRRKHFLSVQDFPPEILLEWIDLAIDMKKNKQKYTHSLSGKKLGMIFKKSSTRTRVSFEAGIFELGGIGIFLNNSDIQLGRGESIADTARVLSRYLDGIMIRTFEQAEVEELAEYSTIPVINGLTDLLHPCQALADIMTIREKLGKIEGIKICFIGDGNNVAHSLGLLASKLGAHFTIATPSGYEMDSKITRTIQNNAQQSGSIIKITNDSLEAIKGAEVVYTDVWTSMGQEAEANARLKAFAKFQVNSKLTINADPDYIFMHCLPAHRGQEVTPDVIDSSHSVIFDQAENRLHAQKAIMLRLMQTENYKELNLK